MGIDVYIEPHLHIRGKKVLSQLKEGPVDDYTLSAIGKLLAKQDASDFAYMHEIYTMLMACADELDKGTPLYLTISL